MILQSLHAGQRVFGRFRLRRILGHGGMGLVWLAQDEVLKEELALKFLFEQLAGDRLAMRDLAREVKLSRQLTHPHIVRIHGLATMEGMGGPVDGMC